MKQPRVLAPRGSRCRSGAELCALGGLGHLGLWDKQGRLLGAGSGAGARVRVPARGLVLPVPSPRPMLKCLSLTLTPCDALACLLKSHLFSAIERILTSCAAV